MAADALVHCIASAAMTLYVQDKHVVSSMNEDCNDCTISMLRNEM